MQRLTRVPRRCVAAAAGAILAGLLPPGVPFARADDRDPDDRGAALFLRGEGAEAVLADGRLRRPAAEFTCAGCHGADGRGRREGGTVFPPVIWSALADPARPGGAYTDATLADALESGRAPDGRSLSAAMPRFDLSDPALAVALARYLDRLDADQRRGVSVDAIVFSAPDDPDAAQGFATALAIETAAGGAWGRRLAVGPADQALATAQEAAEALAPARADALAQAAARVLRGADLGTVAARGDAAAWEPALVAAGITPSATAEASLDPAPGGARLVLPDGRILLLGPTGSGSPPTSGGTAENAQAEGRLLGESVARAALDCGRAVTRACLLERLGRADIAHRYHARPAEPSRPGE